MFSLQSLLTLSSNMLLVGVGDQKLASHLADFATMLLQTGVYYLLLFFLSNTFRGIYGSPHRNLDVRPAPSVIHNYAVGQHKVMKRQGV